MSRQKAAVQEPSELEVFAELRRDQAAQLEAKRATAEHVRVPAAERPRARPAEREAEAPVLDERVHLIEDRRHLLDLVDDDEAWLRHGGELLSEQSGSLLIAEAFVGSQEVDTSSFGVGRPEQRALPDLARPPEKEAVLGLRREQQSRPEHQV